jgi:8-oxo-dGTP pyrophosphatase MutT (NUDIX family)
MAEDGDTCSDPKIAAAREPEAKPRNAIKPRPAASMVLLDRSGAEPKVLLGRRNAALAFLPGKFVFPGGRLEIDDRRMPAAGALRAKCLRRLALRRPRLTPTPEAFALAAIRETFEETGLLLGTKAQTASAAAIPSAWQDFTKHGFMPFLTPMRFIARALTPTAFPRRYDTRFFLLDIDEIAHRIEGCITPDAEFVELVWLTLAEALQCDIPRITAMILRDLETRIAADFPEHLPVPFFYMRGQRWIREELSD